MQEYNLAAYFIPSEDSHQSEYIAPWDARRAFISGFDGSAGYAMVTLDKAALWTDGRYYIQAEKQLNTECWQLMKDGLSDTPKKEEWLEKHLKKGDKVGLDPQLISFEDGVKLKETLKEKGLELTLCPKNLVDEVWGSARPKPIYNSVQHLSLDYSGKGSGEKVKNVIEKYLANKYEGFVVSELDDIAWLFNLRGSDILYNPVFFSYAYISSESRVCTLYLAANPAEKSSQNALAQVEEELLKKQTDEDENEKSPLKLVIKPYEQIIPDLQLVKSLIESSKKKILVSKACNMALVEALGGKENVFVKASPIAAEKAIKNEVELKGFRECHKQDGASLVKFFAWLKDQIVTKNNSVDEFTAAEKLEEIRKAGKDFVGLSFSTISGAGPNGAIIHYKPEKSSARKISANEVYLCDSGAQYRSGTTDTTRTLHFGTPNDFERAAFTRVLKGVIALDSAIFPKGTTGIQLDTLARMNLWAVGLDYRHGTGHGVGHFLNVHEGPQSISFRRGSSDEPLKAGMTVTDEPGYYHDGKFGIRIENILLVKKVQPENSFGGSDNWLGFENVTCCPIDLNLIDGALLNAAEIKWLNEYHERVCQDLLPFLKDDDPLAVQYLLEATRKYSP